MQSQQAKSWTERSKLLAMDTSTGTLTAALMEGTRLLNKVQIQSERNHSIHIAPAINGLLEANGWKPSDLDGVASGIGPGSYTGVRIGVTMAKTMAWIGKLTLIGVSSLEALALGGLRESGEGGKVWIVPLMNARRGQAFTTLLEASSSERLRSVVPDGIRLMENWTAEIAARAGSVEEPPRLILFVGEIVGFEEVIERNLAGWNVLMRHHEMDAQDSALIAMHQWKQGETADVYSLIPNYAQLTEAEVNLLAKS